MALRSLPTSEERRDLGVAQANIEIRATEDGADAAPVFTGHAAVFNSRTAIGNPLTWGFYEQISKGAFAKTLNGAGADARMLIDHDSSLVVSRGGAGTLRLSEDATGLSVESDLDQELSYVRDLTQNLRNGNITGMSFGFYVVRDKWESETVTTSDGQEAEVEIRTILEVRLIEVSAVTFPAYEETDAGLRALALRADANAIKRRVQFMPAMSKLLADIDRETGESTRGEAEEVETAASTRLSLDSIAMRKKALLARFPDLSRL